MDGRLSIAPVSGLAVGRAAGRGSRRGSGRAAGRAAGLAVGLVAAVVVALPGCAIPYPVPAGSVVERTPPGPAAPDPAWDGTDCPRTLRQEVLERIGALRRERGLAPLRAHTELVRAAQAHTEDQAGRDRVTHRGDDGSAVADRVARAGYAFFTVGENVAGGYPSAEAVVAAWMDSPGHRAILLSREPTQAGLGYAFRADGRLHHFWTLVVGGPAEAETTRAVACHP